ncbi:hypothetical protein FE257_001383 [Aspergillus nanangensis]|uniref:Uncharacterized protein n=1 Tax=Aspergillus nanangensis TaxID=2582783 RepID=A0AAD4CDU2_ASPNN|nr:hypothetical protein FE257_001383 [Aspergillus nanangensis]
MDQFYPAISYISQFLWAIFLFVLSYYIWYSSPTANGRLVNVLFSKRWVLCSLCILQGLHATYTSLAFVRQYGDLPFVTGHQLLFRTEGVLTHIARLREQGTVIAHNATQGQYYGQFFTDSEERFVRLRNVVDDLNQCFIEALASTTPDFMSLDKSSNMNGTLCNNNPYLNSVEYRVVDQQSYRRKLHSLIRHDHVPSSPDYRLDRTVLSYLLMQVSSQWNDVASRHLITVWDEVRYFLHATTHYLTGDATYVAVTERYIDPTMRVLKGKLDVARDTVFRERLHRAIFNSTNTFEQNVKNARQQLLDKRPSNFNDTEMAIELHDHILPLYYEEALGYFINGTKQQAVDNALLIPMADLFLTELPQWDLFAIWSTRDLAIKRLIDHPGVADNAVRAIRHPLAWATNHRSEESAFVEYVLGTGIDTIPEALNRRRAREIIYPLRRTIGPDLLARGYYNNISPSLQSCTLLYDMSKRGRLV